MSKQEASKHRANFSNDELIDAIRQVSVTGGTRKDVVEILNLDPTKGYYMVGNVIKRLRDQGVAVPELKGSHKPRTLTPEQVEHFNEVLAGSTEEDTEDAEAVEDVEAVKDVE